MVLYVFPLQWRCVLLLYLGILMTVLHCQYHTTTQHCLSRTRSIYSRNKQPQRVEGERESSLPFNKLHCNTKLHLSHHFQTDNRPPAACIHSTPDVCSKQSLWWKYRQRGSVEGRLYSLCFTPTLHPEKLFLSSLAYLSRSAPASTFKLHGSSFHFLLLTQLSSLLQAQMSSTGQGRTA